MKKIYILMILAVVIVSCSGPKSMVKIEPADNAQIQNDSTEYELITFDSAFESWYSMHNSRANYRSQEYYESWNRQYVRQWNYLSMHSRRRSFFEPIVGYEYGTDYGLELNHKLFYYFQYVERVLRIPILPNAPVGMIW